MTSGGLMQLVAYGAQDVYLTANPQVTFFKELYRRHTNFAMESIEQVFNGVASFGKRVQSTISRNGDLVSRVYIHATLPDIDTFVVQASPDYTTTFNWIPFIGQYMIDNVYIEIGGQLIDRHYGEWLHIWNELTLPIGKGPGYVSMVNGNGGIPVEITGKSDNIVKCNPTVNANILKANMFNLQNNLQLGLASSFAGLSPGWNFSKSHGGGAAESDDEDEDEEDNTTKASVASVGGGAVLRGSLPGKTLYVPLEFWFNRHTGLALPLIALQYHEVKINVDFKGLEFLCNVTSTYTGNGEPNPNIANSDIQHTLVNIGNMGLLSCSLYIDYIYLDTDERRRFAQVAHEYLIEQLQFTGTESVTCVSNKLKLSFNHPCKELIWIVQNPSYIDCTSQENSPYLYVDANGNNPIASAKLQFNGQDRFFDRDGDYFNYVQPYQHHTRTPCTGINVYSFALQPEEIQPSGSCNFSRIDNAMLSFNLTPTTFFNQDGTVQPSANVHVYATNYNILRIMTGMGGLAYSN